MLAAPPPACLLCEELSGGTTVGPFMGIRVAGASELLFHGDFHRKIGDFPGLFFLAQTLLVTQLWAHAWAAPVLLLIKDSMWFPMEQLFQLFLKAFFSNLHAFWGLLKSCYHTEHIAARV